MTRFFTGDDGEGDESIRRGIGRVTGEYHEVFPLDAAQGEWCCRTCGTVFVICERGWTVCPGDPLNNPEGKS